jgi:hypothetical protein
MDIGDELLLAADITLPSHPVYSIAPRQTIYPVIKTLPSAAREKKKERRAKTKNGAPKAPRLCFPPAAAALTPPCAGVCI